MPVYVTIAFKVQTLIASILFRWYAVAINRRDYQFIQHFPILGKRRGRTRTVRARTWGERGGSGD
jgi:hypothetical protein